MKRLILIGLSATLLLLICLAYSNHFTNGFEFDDTHTIVYNQYIRDIKNLPHFFTDIKYFGTMPNNQGYRPILVALNTIDYRLAGGLNPVYFHTSIFLSYLLLLILLFSLFKKIMTISDGSTNVSLWALLAVGFYGLHTANAETINYIIMRCDSFSALCIVASLLLYITPQTRKYYLYLITLVIGIGTKEVGVMGAPLLFVYILFFEENCSIPDLLLFKDRQTIFNAFKKSLPALLVSFGLFFLIRKFIIPQEQVLFEDPGSVTAWNYFYTQWFVIAHYIGNFILPLNLSVDPDFSYFETIVNQKVLLSLLLIIALFVTAFVTSIKTNTRPIAFGILWFFITLAPTSSIIPFGQLANDHRTFLPYIGLVLSVFCWLRLLYLRYERSILSYKYLNVFLFVLYFSIISLHAYGAYQRNRVWSSSETLWRDAVVKGPENGRAQMNYGLTLMEQGKYQEVVPYFNKALERFPYWAYIHINMALLKEATGFPVDAEFYFQNAIKYQPDVPEAYLFYARWLHKKDRVGEAIVQLEKGKSISPAHVSINELYDALRLENAVIKKNQKEKLSKLKQLVKEKPSADNYIELSLLYYKSEMYNECIVACRKALAFNPQSAIAYNNICSAYNALKQWDMAVGACAKSLEIDSTFERAKNNLKWAQNSRDTTNHANF